MHWVAQISANLLRDEELIDLIAAAGGKWIFIGMESIDPTNLKDVNKGFNKPGNMQRCWRGWRSATFMPSPPSFSAWIMTRQGWPSGRLRRSALGPQGCPSSVYLRPCLPRRFTKRLESAGRLTRPKHWEEFIPFEMAHTPLRITISQSHAEVKHGWARSYSPEEIAYVVASLKHKPLGYRINILISRLCFRGIYFPQMGRFAWLRVIAQNRRTILSLLTEAMGIRRSNMECQPASQH